VKSHIFSRELGWSLQMVNVLGLCETGNIITILRASYYIFRIFYVKVT